MKKEIKIKEDELRRVKSVFRGILHDNETQSQQLKEKEELVKQQEVQNNTLKQEMDQLKFQIAEATGL